MHIPNIRLYKLIHVDVGASPAGLVLAGPLFWQCNEKNCTLHACLILPDHYKTPSYAPDTYSLETGRSLFSDERPLYEAMGLMDSLTSVVTVSISSSYLSVVATLCSPPAHCRCRTQEMSQGMSHDDTRNVTWRHKKCHTTQELSHDDLRKVTWRHKKGHMTTQERSYPLMQAHTWRLHGEPLRVLQMKCHSINLILERGKPAIHCYRCVL